MTKWELAMYVGNTHEKNQGVDARNLWNIKDKDGRSTFDVLNDMAKEGWELVSITPMMQNGWTYHVLFSFRRPLE